MSGGRKNLLVVRIDGRLDVGHTRVADFHIIFIKNLVELVLPRKMLAH